MLSVFFDHQIFTLQKYGGISRYFVDLALGLKKQNLAKPKIISAFHFNEYLRSVRPPARTPSLFLPYSSHRLLNRCFNPAHNAYTNSIIQQLSPDIIHHTYYSGPSSDKTNIPNVLTVYDMIHEKYPENFPNSHILVEAKRQAILSADSIICISNTTLNDLVEIYPTVAQKATPILLDVPKPHIPYSTLPCLPSRPFILYVGHRQGYKNFATLLRSYLSSKHLYQDYDLVAFGGGPFSSNELAHIANSRVPTKSVTHLSGPDTVLHTLLKTAACLVYPSLYEGFGIPPVEAMHLGCPVVASHSSCLPEVLSDAALYFDPLSSSDLTNVLRKLLGDSELIKHMASAGRSHASTFATGTMIRKTHQLYASLI